MFNNHHYVPVLRWRKAEYMALSELNENIKTKLTPFIEMWPKDFDPRIKTINKQKIKIPVNVDEILLKRTQEFLFYWGKSPFFLDFNHYNNRIQTSQGELPISLVANQAKNIGISPIPVLGLKRTQQYITDCKMANSSLKTGVCLRIYPDDLSSTDFTNKVKNLISFLNLSPSQIDIVFDNQFINTSSINISAIYNYIPNIESFRTFILMGGYFPLDLSKFSVGSHLLERNDYKFWITEIKNLKKKRLPIYSDYTIQHPFLNNNLPPIPNPSASIRYTSDLHWVIMRGEALHKDNGLGYEQYPANAELLCNRSEYCGPDFSQGDKYISTKRMVVKNPGSPGTWLQAGINHHLTFVVRQLASLSDS